MNEVAFTIFGLAALFFVRTNLVAVFDIRRLGEIHANNTAAINRGDYETAKRGLSEYDNLTAGYVARLLDLRKWTYRQFFGRSQS